MQMPTDSYVASAHVLIAFLGVVQTALLVWNHRKIRKIEKNTNGKDKTPHD